MTNISSDFFTKNRKNFIDSMSSNSIAIFFAGDPVKKSADSFYPFSPNRNFYYLTGISEAQVILLISNVNNKIEETLFILKSDPVLVKWVGETISSEKASSLSGIDNVLFADEFYKKLNSLIMATDPNVYLDLEVDSAKQLKNKVQAFAHKLKKTYPSINVKNAYSQISKQRVIKSNKEICMIKKAIAVTKKGFYSMMKNSKANISENLLEAYFDFELKSENVTDHAFDSIIASGKNATILHYVDNSAISKQDDLVLCDIGAEFNHYKSDITRTFPINGKFTERQATLYNIVLGAQEEVIKNIKPGLTLVDLKNLTVTYYEKALMNIGLIKEKSEVSKYFYHGTSHSLGLDTHDVGGRELVLTPGMVITVEPGLYVEEESIGIRIEDDILITEDGCENLSSDIIKTVSDIENFMKK